MSRHTYCKSMDGCAATVAHTGSSANRPRVPALRSSEPIGFADFAGLDPRFAEAGVASHRTRLVPASAHCDRDETPNQSRRRQCHHRLYGKLHAAGRRLGRNRVGLRQPDHRRRPDQRHHVQLHGVCHQCAGIGSGVSAGGGHAERSGAATGAERDLGSDLEPVEPDAAWLAGGWRWIAPLAASLTGARRWSGAGCGVRSRRLRSLGRPARGDPARPAIRYPTHGKESRS